MTMETQNKRHGAVSYVLLQMTGAVVLLAMLILLLGHYAAW
jgi:hypothetical protein